MKQKKLSQTGSFSSYIHTYIIHVPWYLFVYDIISDPFLMLVHASQEQTQGGKKRPSVVSPLSMLFIVQGTIRAKNKKIGLEI